jgi:hypothetical protein
VGPGVGDTGVHEGLVLLLVIAIVAQEAAAGEWAALPATKLMAYCVMNTRIMGQFDYRTPALQQLQTDSLTVISRPRGG